MSFQALFQPRGIAVVGASADLSRIGGQPIQALKAAGYAGRIYPVNPKYDAIAGLPCMPSIAAIDGPCDMAVVAVRADAAADAVRACGAKGIGFAVILSGGFRETGPAGLALEDQLVAAAREARVRLIGPNCQGMLAVHDHVFAVFGSISGEVGVKAGSVSMCFQSGGVGFAVVTLCDMQGIGFRNCVSTGNEADVKMPELLDALLDDPGTSLVCTYVEGVQDGRALMAAGEKALALGKPVLVWKGGKTETGARAAASHTANLTGRYDIFRAACRQSGLMEVQDVDEIVDLVQAFSGGRLPGGRNVGVIGISGGTGIVFADAAIARGLALPQFEAATAERLSRIIPSFGSVANPADVTASVFNDVAVLTEAIDAVLADPGVDQLCLLLASAPDPVAAQVAQAIVAAKAGTHKPILVGWSVRRARAERGYALLEAADIPILSTPVRLARAAAGLADYAALRAAALGRTPSAPITRGGETEAHAGDLLPPLAGALDEAAGKRLLAAYGIPTPKEVFVPVGADLQAATADLAFPLAAKVVSPDIAHKTEAGGVALGVPDVEALAAAVDRVIENARAYRPGARVAGVLVSEMIDDALEVLVGVVNDPAFGPVVAVGLGGVLTEVLRDVAYRIAPCDRHTIRAMLDELRGRPLFDGVRGRPALDLEALVDAVVAISRLAWDLRDRVRELDVNPLFVRPRGKGVAAADALVMLNAAAPACAAAQHSGSGTEHSSSMPCRRPEA
ncbi:MAG: hypothetical protein B7Y12_06675 [Rhizobiales bacterium 24-66-13]|jgi:acetyltransferase|uniref:acetate--CoA ligase family protein n=1 Tax=Roseixanthobacter finlandensis TaxID=3119922 RepID=UPI000BC68EFA|nr:MAG: hypothetical protein B7Y61_04100 [Rhizobiales bacterium 35-66-30]OYZ81643.1 MAG: hypothetical protein B7Y12_06675 [Rhizobiales bacterium 24-66-13]OZB09092.1 MAG: hypothetical protein B7X67_07265 [Rhizobiales bacterium 39-66-18]HQS09324.1 acetate--CoA ligase family protein [Xanthobacteraceae bacterium]HQS47524.1 acetate--CoA ligase family protein [Xanthobacteraceae bacterium]